MQRTGNLDEEDGKQVASLLNTLTTLGDIEHESSKIPNDADAPSPEEFLLPMPWGNGFVLLERIDGGMTGAYLAAQESIASHRYVLKILHDPTPVSLQRLQQEAIIVGRLHDCGLKRVPFPVCFGWHEGMPFFAMEYIAGKTLKQLIGSQDWQPSVDRICELITDASQTFAKAHRLGVLHRDIKPSNLMITNDGEVRVIDFGVAKDAVSDGKVTTTGLVPGTQAYMSPEQLSGKPATNRSDIFSLGTVFHELLTRSEFRSPRLHAEALDVASRMTDRCEDKRFQSFEDVVAKLNQLIDRDKKPKTRGQTKTWFWTAALVLVACGVGWFLDNPVLISKRPIIITFKEKTEEDIPRMVDADEYPVGSKVDIEAYVKSVDRVDFLWSINGGEWIDVRKDPDGPVYHSKRRDLEIPGDYRIRVEAYDLRRRLVGKATTSFKVTSGAGESPIEIVDGPLSVEIGDALPLRIALDRDYRSTTFQELGIDSVQVLITDPLGGKLRKSVDTSSVDSFGLELDPLISTIEGNWTVDVTAIQADGLPYVTRTKLIRCQASGFAAEPFAYDTSAEEEKEYRQQRWHRTHRRN